MAKEHIFRLVETAKESEAALSPEEVSEALRLIRRLVGKGGQLDVRLENELRSFDALLSSPRRSTNDRIAMVELARRTFIARRLRDRFINAATFGEPAWDMLLALYFTEASERQTISTLSEHSGVSATTALRWIDFLLDQGVARRRAHMTDRRASYIEITDKGRDALDGYFSALLEKGFADQ